MGRPIKFNLSGVSLEAEITKVDRSKLYGTSTRVVYDENGEECSLSDLYQGSAILPKGSISQTLLDSKGNYVSRSDLIGFNNLNQKVEKVSSFQQTVSLLHLKTNLHQLELRLQIYNLNI